MFSPNLILTVPNKTTTQTGVTYTYTRPNYPFIVSYLSIYIVLSQDEPFEALPLRLATREKTSFDMRER